MMISPRFKKIVIAPDKFKGSLSAVQVCRAIAKGIRRHDPTIETISTPMADGGEGSLTLLRRPGRKTIKVMVSDPLFRKIRADYLYDPLTETAYIEMSRASGLDLLSPQERDPRLTTTYGTGELINHALRRQPRRLYLFVGGSATNDAGIGMAGALGYKFITAKGVLTQSELTGGNLIRIKTILPPLDLSRLNKTRFFVVTDVSNPLYGKRGAAYVFGAQKGADLETVAFLDRGLRQVGKIFGTVSAEPGSGAAGGLGAGAMFFLKAKIQGGVDFFIRETGLTAALRGADLVISGEGKMDSQTLGGKVVSGVGKLVKSKNSRATFYVVCGQNQASPGNIKKMGIKRVYPLTSYAASSEDTIRDASSLITRITQEMMRDVKKEG